MSQLLPLFVPPAHTSVLQALPATSAIESVKQVGAVVITCAIVELSLKANKTKIEMAKTIPLIHLLKFFIISYRNRFVKKVTNDKVIGSFHLHHFRSVLIRHYKNSISGYAIPIQCTTQNIQDTSQKDFLIFGTSFLLPLINIY